MRIQQGIDLNLSYGANSIGTQARRIIDCYGKQRLGIDAWEMGKNALAILLGKNFPPNGWRNLPSAIERIGDFEEEVNSFLNELIYPLIADGERDGLVVFQSEKKQALSLIQAWDSDDFAGRVLVSVEFMRRILSVYPDPSALKAVSEPFAKVVAFATLSRLADAASAEFCSSNDMGELLSDAKTLAHYPQHLSDMRAMHNLSTQLAAQTFAKAGTDARHTKSRERKQNAFAWLDENPPPPRGKANAARYIAKHFFVTEDTGKEWVKEWEKKRGGVCP